MRRPTARQLHQVEQLVERTYAFTEAEDRIRAAEYAARCAAGDESALLMAMWWQAKDAGQPAPVLRAIEALAAGRF